MNLLKTQIIQSVTIKILFFVCLLVCTAGIHLKIGNPHSIFIIEQWKAEDPIIPLLRNPITDITSTLTKKEKTQLTNRLISFETEKGSQIAVLIVGSTGEWTIEEYAVNVFEKTKLGRKEIDDGVLIVVAIQDHKTRIEVGYGLEGIIPDATAKKIVEEFMIPKFREGNYFQGISDGIDATMAKINGEELSQTNKIPKFFEVINEYSIDIFPTFVSIIVIISILISIGIFGTIGMAGILIFIGYIWESIILGIGILILLILCFSMTVYLKKKMRRKSFWDYIIVSVYISLVIFGTIGLIGVLFFIGLISESIILGIGILILLILFFSMTGYLKEKIRRKSFWDYILFGATTSSSDSSRSGRSSSGSWGSSSSSSNSGGGSSWSGGGGSSGGGGASGSW
ncbi:TPM domain-containing protein [Leptospira noguchii]|uniref:PF04536 family protein n=1 Tax=Leptospira noguchii serovar Panama str. CZ214 TaxID=1001595 RepID=T0FHW3_9LEPT|nr:TPM domain-containing protein [Leptospira noguchii]EQA72933.1 PF04536 family protein [Leptospira noguchii serovar Panama str. CZ214]